MSDQANHRFAEAVRDYAAPLPQKCQKLLTLQPGIAELRRKGASYQTITDILRAADVPVSRTTVARFCRNILKPPHPLKLCRPASRKLATQPQCSSVPPLNKAKPQSGNPEAI